MKYIIFAITVILFIVWMSWEVMHPLDEVDDGEFENESKKH